MPLFRCVQMGSVTVGAGAAAGVFERESDLLSENRSAMSTQVCNVSAFVFWGATLRVTR